MLNLRVRNVNEALPVALMHFREAIDKGTLTEVRPRGQRRLEWPEPYSTTYMRPRERVLFDPVRNANPFFHLADALWLLAGRNDVESLAYWLPKIADYSDNGKIFHGAYGARLNKCHQLNRVVTRLKMEKDSTRCVLQIYDRAKDSAYMGKDMPCNTMVFLSLRGDVLDLTVCNRSNDLIWGAYGANAVQFSMLHEYLAAAVHADVGYYVQFSNNTHIYPDEPSTQRCLGNNGELMPMRDLYETEEVQPFPLVHDFAVWRDEVQLWWVHMHRVPYKEPFFNDVMRPLSESFAEYRVGRLERAIDHAQRCAASDWRRAAVEWLRRKEKKSG